MTDDLEEQLIRRLHARAAAVTPSPPARSDLDRRIRHRQRRRMAVTGSVAAVALAAGAGTALSVRHGAGNRELVSAAHPDEGSTSLPMPATTSLAGVAEPTPVAPPSSTTPTAIRPTTIPTTTIPPTTIPPTTIPPTSTSLASTIVTRPGVVAASGTTTIPPRPPFVRPAACATPEQQTVPLPDLATVQHLLVGNWLACDSPSFFGTDDAGLVLGADGHWAKLARTGVDLVEMDGRDNRGSWEILDTSSMNGPGHFQINLTSLAGGTRMSSVVIIAPSKLVLDNMGVFSGTYVPAGS
jgi:hypothetical protein